MSRFDLSDPPYIKIARSVTDQKVIYLRDFPNHQIDADNSVGVNPSQPSYAFIVTF